MRVCGFTIIRNAIILDYPVVEAIRSILPACDSFVVAVGKSEDDTLGLIKGIGSDKITIIETEWDDSLRKGGSVLAAETDKALKAIPSGTDWCFYIQADEAMHERFIPVVREAMERYKDDPAVEGLLFNYEHFYGSFDFVGDSWKWYRREIRIIRYNPQVFSYRDAQGFRKKPNEKLQVRLIDAFIYHYGWVRDPRAMQRKQKAFSQLYHHDEWIEEHFAKAEEFDYSEIDTLRPFTGTHPKVMEERIGRINWKFDHDPSRNKITFRERLKRLLSALVGYRVGEYRNYRLLK